MTLLFALFVLVAPADTLHLQQAYREAEAHHPRSREPALYDAAAALRVQNLNARFLPAPALTGQAVYHSDVPALDLGAPGVTPPTISHDQYKLALGVEQLVYDGGLVAGQRALEEVQREAARQEVAVALYQLRDQVNAAFFGVLLQQARLASLATLAEDLAARHAVVQARVREGVALASHADVLAVERLRVEQQQAEAEAQRRAGLAVLGELLGRSLSPDEVLALPAEAQVLPDPASGKRPEYAAFALERERLAGQQVLAARKTRPQVTAFVETAFGRPVGLNFFDDAFSPFFTLGVRARWPVWDWRTSRREREVLAVQQQIVETREDAFTQQLRTAGRRQEADVERLRELLARDDEIIALRRRIAAQVASQLDGGVATATDYLVERNAAYQAELTRALHRLQLVQAQVTYRTLFGTP